MQRPAKPFTPVRFRLQPPCYDLYITNAYNLHCTGCSVLDYGGDYDKKGFIGVNMMFGMRDPEISDYLKDLFDTFNKNI